MPAYAAKTPLRQARDQKRHTISEALSAFDGLPNVIGWNINEEPEAKLSEAVEYGYEIFKSYNPRHLVASLSCDPRWFHHWKNTADVLIVDNYPFRGQSPNKRSLNVFAASAGRAAGLKAGRLAGLCGKNTLETYEQVRDAAEAMRGKAVWLMPQLLTPSQWSRHPEDDISLGDMRLQNYCGLIAGAKGIIMYHWHSLPIAYQGSRKIPVGQETFQRRWSSVKAVVAEMFLPDRQAGQPAIFFAHRQAGQPAIFFAHRQAGQPVLRLTGLPAYGQKRPRH